MSPRAAKPAIRLVLVAMLSVAGLAACGSTTPSPSAAVDTSAAPSPSSTPGANEPSTSASTGSAEPNPANASATPVASSGAATLQACGLLTGAELSKILGITGIVPTPMPSSGWVAGQCAWHGPASGFLLSLGTADSIKAFGDATAPDAKAKLAQFKSQAGGKDVPGIGDAAVVGATGLAAYKGGTYLQLTNLGLTKDQLIAIAKLAIPHL